MDYNHVQEQFSIVFLTVLEKINRNKNKKFNKSFLSILNAKLVTISMKYSSKAVL